ncbi:hypothetical protein [Alcanivorax quisquiliarum]|uniref:Uncharacterized protein n=1 Tax=Alcanivorax quisquiliarum TaxID=2933565 RepID=A0ABT0E901_9GAMM|nr:hypothetical protein [Alcanivorax quisquiliarum]MCK0538318.1 hypothetical protein [Alcanivorax quisquiliarum]
MKPANELSDGGMPKVSAPALYQAVSRELSGGNLTTIDIITISNDGRLQQRHFQVRRYKS